VVPQPDPSKQPHSADQVLIPNLNRSVRSWGVWLATLGFLGIAAATLMPTADEAGPTRLCILCGEFGGADFALNILLFIPFGLGLGLLVRGRVALAAVVCLTCAIELAQLHLIPGRDATVGDVVANSLGGFIGIMSGRHWRALIAPSEPVRRLLLACALGMLMLFGCITAYSVRPAPTRLTYYGQLARQLGSNLPYPGEILRAAVGSVRIPDVRLQNSAALDTALQQGDAISLTVLPHGITSWQSPVMRVADESATEILAVSAQRDRALFGIRTGADELRLRPYVVSLPNAFGVGVPVSIEARWLQGIATVQAHRGSDVQRGTVRFGPQTGWRLFMPWTVQSGSHTWEMLADAVWMIMLGFPIGYWSRLASREMLERRGIIDASLMLGAVGAGLYLPPVVFDSPGADLAAIAFVLAGVGTGACAAFMLTKSKKTFRIRSFHRF
jgi:VanZ family protein